MHDDPVLRKFLTSHANHGMVPPVAVFDCDGTIIKGDVGEAMLYHQIEHFYFATSPAAVWPDHPERAKLQEMFATLSTTEPTSRTEHRAYEPFASMILRWYFGQIEEGRVEKACADIVRLFSGQTADQVRAIARETLRDESAAPLSTRRIGGYTRPRGIRYIRETIELLAALRQLHFDIWVVSGSNRWSVESVFSPLGIPPQHIIGIELSEQGGKLTDAVTNPVPVREKKVEALRRKEPRTPVLVASDSRNDVPLFLYSTGIKFYVNSRRKDSADFFSAASIRRDETWVVVERPTVQE